MTDKEYLKQLEKIDKRIDARRETISRLRLQAEKTTSTFSALRNSGTNNHSKVEDCVVKMCDLETKLEKDIDKCIALKSEILHMINEVPDPICRLLLELRYIQYKSWISISMTMRMSDTYVRGNLHSKALSYISKSRVHQST